MQSEAMCVREEAAVGAAGGGPVPWFAEIAAERDDLQRRALLLHEQKVSRLVASNAVAHSLPSTPFFTGFWDFSI